MSNIFTKIHGTIERNHKNIQIRSSGSTPGAKLEKIRSGQSYLYQKNGMESEVFEITFHKKISGSMLNQALTVAVKRYPYMNTKLVELDGDFYIIQNEMALTARKTATLARLGHISCGYHLVDVTYSGKSVYVSWHHALCDGKGIKPFVETLIWYYCKLRYNSKASSDGIRLANSPLLKDETTEPNLGSYSFDESKQPVSVSRDAYAIPENIIEKHETDYRYDIQVSASAFMKACKAHHATPVILTSLLVSEGIATLYPDFDKPINANVAVDIRAALDLPNTFKNCVRSMPLPFEKEFLSMSLTERAEKQRALLNAQRDRDNLRRAANSSLGLFEKLDSLPDYKSKQGMMDFFNGMLINTYFISYLGQMVVNENAQYIDTVGFYNSGAAGLGVNILSCGNKFCFNFKQSFESDKYVKAFLAGLDKLGIAYKASEAIPFLTPNDSIIKRK
ncbi:MAG: hypothetical protein IJY08_01780 [Clostridia bacterium]|nr:hypothetical protein [Clostridia bacterium]